MPPGDPPPLDPPPGTRSESVQLLSDSIHNPRDASLSVKDASQDVTMDSAQEQNRRLEARQPEPLRPTVPEHTSASLLRSLLAAPGNQPTNGRVSMDVTMITILLQLMDSEAERTKQLQITTEELRSTMKELKLAMADLRELRGRVQTIEAGQLTKATITPNPAKSYAATANIKKPLQPAPPTKSEMVAARPGLSIIHARVGTNPLKDAKAGDVVRKTNDILEKLDAKVNGEKVAVKAVRFLPSGNVSFYTKDRHQKDWLNRNRHTWSKQLHPDLEASPSTYSVLVHGIPRSFAVDKLESKMLLASDNSFLSDKIHRIRWLGGSREPDDPRNAGTIVVSLTDLELQTG
ncbi:hypothetical protein PGT21_035742 [Puccinia graminis f. sp. tritici]|uniref:Uncharacterized protein n=1 Tax=Puccinia graminis f. sp. tritici TaxID=56615 RepID=A0A5B0RX48_PUCGR|nr:hypothetical protein PGT21_035742 [Puccinia graminis f. sp. tritici]KAA1130177.1 hypothetical protein PGTUg99_013344 [Puccinia graminis f. sp. tritici]